MTMLPPKTRKNKKCWVSSKSFQSARWNPVALIGGALIALEHVQFWFGFCVISMQTKGSAEAAEQQGERQTQFHQLGQGVCEHTNSLRVAETQGGNQAEPIVTTSVVKTGANSLERNTQVTFEGKTFTIIDRFEFKPPIQGAQIEHHMPNEGSQTTDSTSEKSSMEQEELAPVDPKPKQQLQRHLQFSFYRAFRQYLNRHKHSGARNALTELENIERSHLNAGKVMEEVTRGSQVSGIFREFLEYQAEEWISNSKPQDREKLEEMRVRYLLRVSEQ